MERSWNILKGCFGPACDTHHLNISHRVQLSTQYLLLEYFLIQPIFIAVPRLEICAKLRNCETVLKTCKRVLDLPMSTQNSIILHRPEMGNLHAIYEVPKRLGTAKKRVVDISVTIHHQNISNFIVKSFKAFRGQFLYTGDPLFQ